MFSFYRILSVLTFLFFSADVFSIPANITVDGTHRYFRAGEVPVKNILVTNKSEKTLDFETEISLWKNAGEVKQGQKAVYDPAEGDFIFAPKVFRLKSGESRHVRMVLSKPQDDEERAYSVGFKPIDIPQEGADGLNKGEVEMGLGFIVTSGMLVLVSPKKPKPNLTWRRDSDKVYITNEGNVSLDMHRSVNTCFNGSVNDCGSLPAKRIYPGKTFELEIPEDKAFKYYYKLYGKSAGHLDIKALY